MDGETISHYRLLQKLGSGGMGVVYSAEDLKLGRKVALKFLSTQFSRDPIALLRFEREARVFRPSITPTSVPSMKLTNSRAIVSLQWNC